MKNPKLFYLLADVLTVSGFLFAGVIIWLALRPIGTVNSLVILALMVAGELRDAADGSLARYARRLELLALMAAEEFGDAVDDSLARYARILELEADLASAEPKRDFWIALDQIADISLALSVCFYIYRQINATFIVVMLAICVPIALVVQIIRRVNLNKNRRDGWNRLDRRIEILVLLRRWGYLALLAVMGLILLFSSSLPTYVEVLILLVGVAVGLVVAVWKMDRLTEDKTPFNRYKNISK